MVVTVTFNSLTVMDFFVVSSTSLICWNIILQEQDIYILLRFELGFDH